MICFSVDSRGSLENVQSKWVAEIASHCEGVKLVLVALKCDLRELEDEITPYNNCNMNGQHRYIQYEEGLSVAKFIRAVRYLGMYFYDIFCIVIANIARMQRKTQSRHVSTVFDYS